MTTRITSLEPDAFADQVCAEVMNGAEYLWRLATGDAQLGRRLGAVERDSELWRSAVAVACYAQTGSPGPEFAEDLPDPEIALTQVVTALYVPLGSRHQLEDFDDAMSKLGGGTKRMAIPLDEPINAILAAAVARLQIACHQPTNPTQLALLASISEDTVRADIRKGLLESEGVRPRLVPASSARTWLSERGVAGYTVRHKVEQASGGWVGLVFSPWHREWGRVTKVYPTERRAVNALAKAMAPDTPGAVYSWVPDPEGLGWRVPSVSSRLGDRIVLA